EEEVFGAMAVFTGEPRSATVIARTPCTIMAVPQKDFILQIEAQPQAAVNLIENLDGRIIILNQQLNDKTDAGQLPCCAEPGRLAAFFFAPGFNLNENYY